MNSPSHIEADVRVNKGGLNTDFDLGLLLFVLKKRLPWIVVIFLLVSFATFLYLRYTQPIYESTTILQIRTDNKAQKILNVEGYEPSEELAEAIELLRSNVFFKRALSKLPVDVSYFTEGTFKANEQYMGAPYSIEVKVKSNSINGRRFNVRFKDEQSAEISYVQDGKRYSKTCTVDKWIEFPHVTIKLNIHNYQDILDQKDQVKTHTFYFIINDLDVLSADYFPRLSVRLLNEAAKTVSISFRDNNARKAQDLVAAMAAEFANFDVERKAESSNSILLFIDQQLNIAYERLKQSENSMQQFKKNNSIVESNITDLGVSRYNTIADQVSSLELEAKILDEVEKNLQVKDNTNTYNLLSMLAGTEYESTVSNLVSTLKKLLIQKEEMLYEVTPNSGKVKGIEYQIEIQKKLLLESVKSIRSKIELKKENLESHTDKLIQSPAENIEYGRLRRLFGINEKYYTILLEKKTEYSISKAGFVSQNVVLQKASLSSSPVSPNKTGTLMAALAIAFLCSILLVLISYMAHNEITSVAEIVKHVRTSVSVLGVIPRYKKDIPVSQLLVDKNPKSLIAEAFRSIRTNLQFISNDSGAKVVALTSTVSGEGKTFIAINLAGIIAYSGKKVIVLDLDMRKPKIHVGFNVENVKGMSTMLIGKDTIDDCIRHSGLENLHFITAGPIPPNPSELIISRKMDEILSYLKTKYEIVIIDNPPVGLVTDGVSVIQKADYPIYIFRANYSRKNFIENIERLFAESKIQKLAIVLNGVDNQYHGYGSYSNGYGYGYGYGYYDDTPVKKKKFGLRFPFSKKNH